MQPPQDLGGEGPHPGTILHDGPRPSPVDLLQHLLDQKAGAGDQRAQHHRVLHEVAGEEQHLLRAGGGLF